MVQERLRVLMRINNTEKNHMRLFGTRSYNTDQNLKVQWWSRFVVQNSSDFGCPCVEKETVFKVLLHCKKTVEKLIYPSVLQYLQVCFIFFFRYGMGFLVFNLPIDRKTWFILSFWCWFFVVWVSVWGCFWELNESKTVALEFGEKWSVSVFWGFAESFTEENLKCGPVVCVWYLWRDLCDIAQALLIFSPTCSPFI